MKKLICTVALVLIGLQSISAMTWEVAVVAPNGSTIKIWRSSDGLYTHNFPYGSLGKVHTGVADSAGFWLDIGDDNECQERCGPALSAGTTYTIVIDGHAVELTTPEEGTSLGDFVITYSSGTFNLININATDPQLGSTFTWTKIDITVKNSFSSGYVKVDDNQYASGSVFGWTSGNSHTLEAVDRQSYADYIRVFSDWSGQQGGTNLSLTATPTYSQQYSANFLREFNITFRNYGPSGSIGGVISVNQTQYNSPTGTFHVNEGSTIRGTASTPQTIVGVVYTFTDWNGSYYSADYTFTPSNHTTYTANFSAKPEAPTSLYISGDPGDQVTLVWTDNPSPYVTQYEIYRSPDKNRPYEYAATVNSGIGTWTDNEWQITSGYTDSLVHYRMYSKYNYGSTHVTSDPSAAVAAYAKPGGDAKRDVGFVKFADNEKRRPNQYGIGNYPNPFNPTTTLFYQLLEISHVRLDICDVSGRIVKTLIDGQHSVGYHATVWNGSTSAGNGVASGIYFYRFIAQPISGHKPFVKSGKLVMIK